MSYSCGIVEYSRSYLENTIISAVEHQIEDGCLLTDISEYKRRTILPFLDQVQEERVVLQGIS